MPDDSRVSRETERAARRAFAQLRGTGWGWVEQPAGNSTTWRSEVAEPFWRACATLADAEHLPVYGGYRYLMFEDWFEDIEPAVYLLDPWTRVISEASGCHDTFRAGARGLAAWRHAKAAGPPCGVVPSPEAVQVAYRTLLADSVVTGPVFRWQGRLKRRRRRAWWREQAGPWLAALVAWADQDARPVVADSTWTGWSPGKTQEWRPRLRLLDPATRTPLVDN